MVSYSRRLGLLGLLAAATWMASSAGSLPAASEPAIEVDIPTPEAPPAASAPAPGGAPANDQLEKTLIPTTDLLSIMQRGGLLMWPIALCSVLMMAFAFERAISLRRSRVIPKPFVKRFMDQMTEGQLDREQALQLCEENGSPVAEVLAGAVRKWGRPAVEVEQGILDAGERATNGLRRYLRWLNTIHTVSPLLGLLGTVTGMIKAFNDVAASDALGRPEMLAAGISEALLTTAAGLSVAIPALLLYLYFTSRVDTLVIEMDSLGQQVVNLISAEELQARSQKPRPAKPARASKPEPAAQ